MQHKEGGGVLSDDEVCEEVVWVGGCLWNIPRVNQCNLKWLMLSTCLFIAFVLH